MQNWFKFLQNVILLAAFISSCDSKLRISVGKLSSAALSDSTTLEGGAFFISWTLSPYLRSESAPQGLP